MIPLWIKEKVAISPRIFEFPISLINFTGLFAHFYL